MKRPARLLLAIVATALLFAASASAQSVTSHTGMVPLGNRMMAAPVASISPGPAAQAKGQFAGPQPAPPAAIPTVADIRAQSGQTSDKNGASSSVSGPRTAQAAAAKGPMVRVGELLESPEGLAPEALAVELLPAPRPGQTMTVQKSRLQELFRERLGEMGEKIDVPGAVTVVSGGRIAQEAELKKLADEFLTRQLAALTAAFPEGMRPEFEVRELKVPAYLILNETGDQAVIEAVGALQPGRTSLRVAARDGHGKTYRQAAGHVVLDAWIMAPCAIVGIPQGGVVSAETVAPGRVNMAQAKGRLWDGQGGPYRARRGVNAGQPVTTDLIESPPLMTKGDKVVLLYETGALRLETPAEVLADARAGETVQVRNMLSKKQVLGRAIDAQTVVVK